MSIKQIGGSITSRGTTYTTLFWRVTAMDLYLPGKGGLKAYCFGSEADYNASLTSTTPEQYFINIPEIPMDHTFEYPDTSVNIVLAALTYLKTYILAQFNTVTDLDLLIEF